MWVLGSTVVLELQREATQCLHCSSLLWFKNKWRRRLLEMRPFLKWKFPFWNADPVALKYFNFCGVFFGGAQKVIISGMSGFMYA